MRKPTLLITSSTFPRWKGDAGPARFVFDLSLRLKRYYRVIVLAPHAYRASRHEEIDGIEIFRFPYFWPLRSQALCNGGGILPALRSGFLPKFQVPSLVMAELYWLVCLLRKQHIDVINSHWMIPQGLIVAIAKYWFRSTPHLLTIHSSDVHTLRRLPGGRTTSRFILKSTDHVITVSNFLHRSLQQLTGREVMARVLPMGVHTSAFARRFNRIELLHRYGITAKSIVLYVGKLIEVKGVATLIQSMNTLRGTCDVQLLIVGTGRLRRSLEAQVQHLSLPGYVRFLGAVNHDLLPELYGLCDVVVVPSIVTERRETEGMPVVILEAMAAGRPVVASNVGGISDVVHDGVNGYLVPPQDADALAERIRRVLVSDIAPRMQRSAVETAAHYDWHHIGERYHECIQDILR